MSELEWQKGSICPVCGDNALDGENMDVEQGVNLIECDSCGAEVELEVSYDFRIREVTS